MEVKCAQLKHVLGEWWQHLRSRHELESLDESMLRDIGLSRGEAGFQASKSTSAGRPQKIWAQMVSELLTARRLQLLQR